MPKTADIFNHTVNHTVNQAVNLRRRAVAHLTTGSRPDDTRSSQTDAMAVLMGLSSSPATASDALAVLHELQVHQVELDLQNEELRASRLELENALARQRYMFEHAPAGLLVLDISTLLCDLNLAAARLLGAPREQLLGRALVSWLSATSSNLLGDLLAEVGNKNGDADGVGLSEGDGWAHSAVTLSTRSESPAHWQAVVNRDSTRDRFLLVLMATPSTA